MNKKVIIISIGIAIIIGTIGIYFFITNKSNIDFKVLNDLSYLKNDKSTILENENNKFYNYESDNEKYIVFKIKESTYKSSIDIKSIKLINSTYNGETLNIELKINVEEGKIDPLRDWPLYDEKYIVMKVEKNIERLYVNGYEYDKV